MKTLIVGHRGTGKTTLLERIGSYYFSAEKPVKTIDLDTAIEKRTGKTITEIFVGFGESEFRKIETDTLRELCTSFAELEEDVFIAVGAGFHGTGSQGRVSPGWQVLWVRRPSDPCGRVFLERPRLNNRLGAIEEYHERYVAREAYFRSVADEVLTLQEGFDTENEGERAYFCNSISDLGGVLTLLPQNFKSSEQLHAFLQRRLEWGVQLFELRDDLLTAAQIRQAIRVLPVKKCLLSLRDHRSQQDSRSLLEEFHVKWDWPIEWGAADLGTPTIYSLHERQTGRSLVEILRSVEQFHNGQSILKVALSVVDLQELEIGHEWQSLSPGERVFLPVSDSGRWSWYRSLMNNALGYFCEGPGLVADQPTLLERLEFRSKPERFAAVLGSPVIHSRTPSEHKAFFAHRGMPVLRIELTEPEVQEGGLDFLHTLGLSHAAVTSPLKEVVSRVCARHSPTAVELAAVNTILWKNDLNGWQGENTDFKAFQEVVEMHEFNKILPREIAIWGGGGTLAMLAQALPGAKLFSARSGLERNASGEEEVPQTPSQFARGKAWTPRLLIWAVDRGRWKESGRWPPQTWRPNWVLDLNYSEDSPGREWSARASAHYISGLQMFRNQAALQQIFWSGDES